MIEFIKDFNTSNIDYFKQVLRDADNLTVSVRWNFNEQQADPFHHNFTSDEFIRRLKKLITQIKEE